MKKSELSFSFVQVFVDFILIVGAILLAFKLRHTTSVQALINKEGLYNVSFEQYLFLALIIAVIGVIVFVFEGLYNIRST
ncbi:MAG: hypothetical protein U9Q12_03535, partial [Patescibacteria group bacterium]|nr:hypothetical protein [Patescibacteria group bacterium]